VRSRPLGRRSLDLNHAHQFLWFCSEGVYQPCLGVLGVPLITVPGTYGVTSLARYDLSQVHTVQHKPRKSSVRDTIYLEQKDLSVLKFSAPDTIRCTRAVQLRTSHSGEFQGSLRYNSPDCPVSQRSNGSLHTNGRLQKLQCTIVPRQKSERRNQRAQTVQCSKTTSVSNGQLLQTLTVALTWRAPDSAQ
jgi:hypothetical protein